LDILRVAKHKLSRIDLNEEDVSLNYTIAKVRNLHIPHNLTLNKNSGSKAQRSPVNISMKSLEDLASPIKSLNQSKFISGNNYVFKALH
jgi:hypothetical protein